MHNTTKYSLVASALLIIAAFSARSNSGAVGGQIANVPISTYGEIGTRAPSYWGAWLSPYIWNWEPNWNGGKPTFGKQQIELLASTGCNCLAIALDRLSWLYYPEKANYAAQLSEWAKEAGMKVVAWLDQDSGNWVNDSQYLTGQQIISNPALVQLWISWGLDVIDKLKPNAIMVMDDADFFFTDYYSKLAMPCYNAFIAAKPDILVYVTGGNIYNPGPWQGKLERNMIITTYLYYHPSINVGNEFDRLYRDATTQQDLENARESMYGFYDSMLENLSSSKISFGTGTLGEKEPNWQYYMEDVYNYAKSRGLYELWQFCLATGNDMDPNYSMLNWNASYQTLNNVGQLWAQNRPT